jgi:hypothetical protein
MSISSTSLQSTTSILYQQPINSNLNSNLDSNLYKIYDSYDEENDKYSDTFKIEPINELTSINTIFLNKTYKNKLYVDIVGYITYGFTVIMLIVLFIYSNIRIPFKRDAKGNIIYSEYNNKKPRIDDTSDKYFTKKRTRTKLYILLVIIILISLISLIMSITQYNSSEDNSNNEQIYKKNNKLYKNIIKYNKNIKYLIFFIISLIILLISVVTLMIISGSFMF